MPSRKWQTFLANSAQQFFRVADYDTARFVSNQLGQRTVKFGTQSSSALAGRDSANQRHSGATSAALPFEALRCFATECGMYSAPHAMHDFWLVFL
jgi:type IV secretory system conjugative DNA transfer VirD4/TraG family protein